MRKSDFHYELPAELIAQRPLEPRSAARLLCLERPDGGWSDERFADLPARLRPGDVLVLNDTRVIPARLLGRKQTGGRIEALIERVLDARRALALVRASKPPAPGQRLRFDPGVEARVGARRGEFYELAFEGPDPLPDLLERHGRVPLPPYIARAPEAADRERYQTVYARAPGAVAAPTAGLHFDAPLLERLARRGIEQVYITLHVGAGTFLPLRGEELAGQRLHAERVRVSAAACARINRARAEGRRIVAVGTTVVRALEAAAGDAGLVPLEGETDIFIYPGFRFRAVDALVTNFHLPESSLLMLVCAFGGTERVLAAYRHAVRAGYRFYSYGDAMYLVRAR
jgi:S-adenosylmethionine:tRNA ribosyltransferase-isomerase